jgi:hypothetical protein
MNQQVFIAFQGQRMTDSSFEPQSLLEVIQIDVNSKLVARAKALSEDGLAVAFLEFESDVLRFWAFKFGILLVQYNSSPTFATCTITRPEGSDLQLLAELFGVPEQGKAIEQLLLRKRGLGFLNETQRLELLLGLLGFTNNVGC